MVSVLAFWRWMVARRRHWPWRSLDISGEVHEFAEIQLNKLAEIQLNKHAEIQLKKLAEIQLNKLAEIQLNNHNCELDRWYKTKHSTNESISRFNEILNFDISAIEHLTSFFGITSNSILLKNTLLEVWCLVGMICDTSWCPQVLVACQTLFKVDSVDSKCHISCRRQLQKQTEEVWRVCNLQWQISGGQYYGDTTYIV